MWMLWVSFLVRWVLLAAAVALTAWVLPDVALEGGVWASLWVALLIAFANVVVQLLLGIIPKPNALLVLALLTLAVNGLLVWAVSAVSSHFSVDGFVAAVGAAILISVFSVALEALASRLLPDGDRAQGDAVPG
jgi:putative membrane protein